MDTYLTVAAATVGVISTPVCVFFILFRYFPQYLVRIGFIIRQFHAGMKIKYVGDENFVFCYGEKNVPRPDRTSIVFVHGFTSSKVQWISSFKLLPKDLHLIALDLPGHGASSLPRFDDSLSIEYLVESIDKFLQLVGLADKKIHLVGSSLGGALAGVFAAHHPEKVEKLTMLCPAMRTPVNSDFGNQVNEAIAIGVENVTTDNCKLLPTDVVGMKAMLEMCCFNKDAIKIADQIVKGFLHMRLPNTDFYLQLFKAILSVDNRDLLLTMAVKITAPTQLIWGQQDEVIHVSGAELLKSKLPNCQRMDLIDRCGHAIDIDRPGAFAKWLITFIQSDIISENPNKKSN